MLKNICKIAYLKKSEITLYLASTDAVKILPDTWTEIPITPASTNTCELTRKTTASGWEYTVNIQALVRTEPTKLPIILRLDLDSGETIIIGDTDLPVKLEFSGMLQAQQLTTTHKSWRKPLILTT
nr:hypothetical protein [uncultured Pedobacter sp.]